MKKTLSLIIVLLIALSGCFDRHYSNSEIIEDLNQRTSTCNNMGINVSEVSEGIGVNENYIRIGTTDSAIYYYIYSQVSYNYTFKSGDYWRDVFGNEIKLTGIAGPIWTLHAKKNGRNYVISFRGLQLYARGGMGLLNEGQYKINGTKFSYLCLKGIESDLQKNKVATAGRRMIMYQVDIELETMKVDLKMLGYKTWRTDNNKLIEEKYFY